MKSSEYLVVYPLWFWVHPGFPLKSRRKQVESSFLCVTKIKLIVVLDAAPKPVGFRAIKLIASPANLFYSPKHHFDEI